MTSKFRAYHTALQLHEDSMASDVLKFMTAFEQPPGNMTRRIPQEDFQLAHALMQEELQEMADGFVKFQAAQSLENAVEFADGAIDSIYVILWTLLKFGMPVDKLHAEVQRSNMAKLNPDGSFSKFPEGHPKAGKVKKADGWTPPDLHKVLLEHVDRAIWRGGVQVHNEQDGYLTPGSIASEGV